MTVSRHLSGAGILRLLYDANRTITRYEDDTVVTWYDNGVEPVLEIEEAMGSDDGENFDFDGNLDT